MEPIEKVVDVFLAHPGWHTVWRDSSTKELFIGDPIVAWAHVHSTDKHIGDYHSLQPMIVNELGRWVEIEESTCFGILGPGENIKKFSHIL